METNTQRKVANDKILNLVTWPSDFRTVGTAHVLRTGLVIRYWHAYTWKSRSVTRPSCEVAKTKGDAKGAKRAAATPKPIGWQRHRLKDREFRVAKQAICCAQSRSKRSCTIRTEHVDRDITPRETGREDLRITGWKQSLNLLFPYLKMERRSGPPCRITYEIYHCT